ncbi:MAG: choice-of-anchor D domain-containing protein [Myxococcales bacterium]
MTTRRTRVLSKLAGTLLPLALLGVASCCKRSTPGNTGGCTGALCSVSGEGVAPPIDFGDVPVGTMPPRSAKLTLTNMGSDTLNIGGETIGGADASDFKLASKLPSSLAPGASVSAVVQFSPSVGGERTAVITIQTDGSPAAVPVQVKGNGLDIQICSHPTTLDFGPVQVLGTPVPRALDIGNCGSSPVTISFTPISGPNAGDFTETGEQNQTLQPGQSVNITVSYQPSVMGPSTANLPYDVCGGSCPQSVNLTGVGVDGQLVCSPNPISFGTVASSATPPVIPVTCTNVGTEVLNITGLGTYSGSNAIFAFSGLPAFPDALSPVPPNQGFTFNVTYHGSGAAGGDSDELVANWTVEDPAVALRQYTDLLSGNQQAGPCSLTVSPSQVTFGNVAVGSSPAKSISLSNVGGTVCNVSAIALGAGTDAFFGLASGQATSFQVQPGTSGTIGVTFSPTSSNPPLLRKGSVTFTSDDPANGSGSVPLSAFISNQTQYSGGWPKWHMDNFNTGYSSDATAGLKGVVLWKYNIGKPSGVFGAGTYINSPVIDGNGNVYQMDINGKLYSLSSAGTPNWTQQLSSPSGDTHPSTPAILADGSLFVASGSDGSPPNLYYLSSAGAVVFSEPFGEDGFDSCPTLGVTGTLFLADDDGSGGSDPYSAIAFQASGSSVTQIAGLSLPLTAESERFGVVVASDDSTYWGNNGQFFGITPPSAGFKQMAAWPGSGVTTSNAGTSDPNILGAVVSDLALDTQTNNNLYAYSAWEDMSNSGSYTVQGNLAALDPATGAQKWLVTLPATALPSGSSGLASDSGNAAPAIAPDGTVYVGNGDGLRAIDGATGSVKWLFKSANVSSSPAIGLDGTIFYGAEDGNFYAVTSAGTLRFQVPTGGPISASPAIGADSNGSTFVAFTSDDGNVYAIQ